MKKDSGLRLTMIRENLLNLPEFELPREYSYVWYQPGYEKEWVNIQQRAEPFLTIDAEKYKKEFVSLKDELKTRQCFLKNNTTNELIGTATAWFDTAFRGEGWGRVHWVAIVPEEQGKKLAKGLLLEVLKRIKKLNCNKVYLVTSTKRLGAINLYTNFGFVPNLDTKENCTAWAEYLALRACHE